MKLLAKQITQSGFLNHELPSRGASPIESSRESAMIGVCCITPRGLSSSMDTTSPAWIKLYSMGITHADSAITLVSWAEIPPIARAFPWISCHEKRSNMTPLDRTPSRSLPRLTHIPRFPTLPSFRANSVASSMPLNLLKLFRIGRTSTSDEKKNCLKEGPLASLMDGPELDKTRG